MSVYPTGVDVFSPKTDLVSTVQAADINSLQDSVVSIESYLGTNTSGNFVSTHFMNESIVFTGAITNGFINVPLKNTPLSTPTVSCLFKQNNMLLLANINDIDASFSNRQSGVFYANARTVIVKFSGNIAYPYNYPSDPHVVPGYICVDPSGVYGYFNNSNQIYKMALDSGVSWSVVNTGNSAGSGGDGGLAINAQTNAPLGMFVDLNNNLYFADSNNRRVRQVSNGNITTIAGGGTGTFYAGGVSIPATGAILPANIQDVQGDYSGNIYLITADKRISKVDISGNISLFAGTGVSTFSGDGGPAILAGMNPNFGMYPDGTGGLIFPDYNNRVRRVDISGNISTVAGNGIGLCINATGATSTGVCFSLPAAIATDGPNWYVWNGGCPTGLSTFVGLNPTSVYPYNFLKTPTAEYTNIPVKFVQAFSNTAPTGSTSTDNKNDINNMINSFTVSTVTNSNNQILGFFSGTNNVSIFFRNSATTSFGAGITAPYAINVSYLYRS